MAFNWDFAIGAVVVLALILFIWARVSKQTVKDVVLDIVDIVKGGKEEVEEKVEGVFITE